jgi:NADPH:quinone reductase-like Zn-dependent oxidoreductase
VQAIIYTQYGTPDQLHLMDVPKPIPKSGEVLVKVLAASINSWDADNLKGDIFLVRLISGLFSPRHTIPGADIAGVVEAVGNKVNDFKPGDEVLGDIAEAGFGGFAEYVAVPERLLARKSPNMSFAQAAALPQAGLLALQGLRFGGEVKNGEQILINGAGGGVGTLGLQYAKRMGAEVTCVDSSNKFDVLKSLGADFLIDYTREDYTRTGKQYDKILDVIAHRSAADYKRALKPGGTFAMIGGSMGGLLFRMMAVEPMLSKFRSKKIGIMGYRPNRQDLDCLTNLFEEGKVIPYIDSSFALKDTAKAFQHFFFGRFIGKIVIEPVH